MVSKITTVLSLFFCSTIFAQKIGYATYFDGLGTPYGGCGVPTELVGTDNFVALNVFNKPNAQGKGDPTRPLIGADTSWMGEFQNGKNCGRWVKVSILDNCIGGANSGTLGQGFCSGSGLKLTPDQYNGASLYMIVTDACGDNNAWCRESKYHLDLHTSSMTKFELDGKTVPAMFPGSFNNREIKWEYVSAPNYKGDIIIDFMKGSQRWWASILITNLPNGIHAVEQKINGQWVKLVMNSDMGQAYILKDFTPPFQIRVYDANNQLIFNEREYKFDNPCYAQTCQNATTRISYQKTDCNKVMGGTAFIDSCNKCAGGNTGVSPVLNKSACITGINSDAFTNSRFAIYPNPVKDRLIVDVKYSSYDYFIVDLKGELLQSGQYNESIGVGTLEVGIYQLILKNQSEILNSRFYKAD